MIEETQSYSVWQRKTVPTIRINQTMDETGARITLQEVINEAPHFAKILLASGQQFIEQIIVSRPIEICGDDGEEPTIISRGPTISISADIPCFFSGIKVKVRTLNASASVSRQEPPAVLVTSGRPVFFKCEMSSFCAAGTSQPVVERCSIQGNLGGSGLVVRDAAGGTYMTNEITNHTGYCIECSSRGSPKFTNNEVYVENDPKSGANAGIGVLRISGMTGASHAASDDNEVLFSGNRFLDIFSDLQKQAAVEIFGSDRNRWLFTQDLNSQRRSVVIENANPVLVDNIIEGGVVGLALSNAGGTYLNNVISQSILCAIFFVKGTQAVIDSHKIAQHMGGGVFIDQCSPTLRNCVIQQCKGVGISVNSSQNFTVSKCFVEKNRSGVSIIGHSGGIITESEICRNDYFGIRIADPGCRTRVMSNILFNNGGAGVYVINHATPRISKNAIHGQRVGLLSTTGSAPQVTENEIQGNDELAISILGGATGSYKKNMFSGGSVAVVRVQERCNPLFEENEIVDGNVGLLLTNKAIGSYLRNTIRRQGDGINISNFADPLVSENTICECSRYGIFVVQDGMGTVTSNTMRQNVVGFSAFKGARATFRGNTVEKCVKIGGVLGEGCRVLVEKNSFSEHEGHGMVLTGRDCLPVCRINTFTSCKGFGCLSEGGAEGVVSGSFFSDNFIAGFGTEDGGSTEFRENKSVADRGPAILCQNHGFGSFYDCVCEDGRNSGCVLQDGARPVIINCSFTNFLGDGIEVRESAQGELISCTARKNRKCGISFSGACATIVDQLTSEGNNEDGVLICKQAASKLSKSVVRGHTIGIRLQGAGEATIIGCEVSKNERGLVVIEGGSATVVDTAFSFSKTEHIELSEKGSCTIRGCVLTDGEKNGIRARNFCKGLIQDCKILRCAEVGLIIEAQGDPRIERCEIAESLVGLSCSDKAQGTLNETSIHSNKECNVSISGQSRPYFTKCVIARCKMGPGVTSKQDDARFTDCSIQGNATYGVYVGDKSRSLFRTNVIQGNSRTGIYCVKGCECTFSHNKICENHQSGIILATGASPTFNENEISDNLDSGTLCCFNSQGIFTKNNFIRNNVANIRIFAESTAVFTNNTIQLGKSTGVVVQGGSARFEENHITQHLHAAVLVIGPSSTLFLKNAIQSNNIGVVLEAEGQCPIPNASGIDPTTIIAHNSDGASNATQGKRRQRGVAIAAVKMVQEAKGSTVTLESNVFSANKVAGVQMHRGSAPIIVKNQFSDGDTGVQIFSLAQGVVESNILMAHRLCAIEVNGPSIVTKIRLNLFDANEVGVLIKGNTSSVNRRSRPGSARSDRGTGGPPRINILDALGKADIDLDDASLYGDGDQESEDSSEDSSLDSAEKRKQEEEELQKNATIAGFAVVTITKNTFIRNKRHGCYLTDMSESNITGNAFQSELCAVGGTSGSSPTVSDNVFSRCVVGVHSGATTNFLIEKNQFVDETEIGVLCNGGTGLVTSNVFANCLVAGVCTEGSGCPSVTRNLFAHNSSSPWSCGIYTRKGGSGYFTDNDIHENSIGVRCDNGGLGSITNDFLHDNGYGMFVSSGGLCTVSTCFFCCNSIADVCSSYGGRPNVSRCVMHDTTKPILLTNYGGGSFTYNILKNVEGSAILMMFPLPTDNKPMRTKPKGLHEILVEPGDVIARDAVLFLLTLEEVIGRIAMRSTPTFSANLIAQCSIGIEIDCGAATKHRIKGKDTKETTAGASAATASAATAAAPAGAQKRKDYVTPLPNLATLQRSEYWAIITRNLITQCVCGVSVAKGPTTHPPRFVPATDFVLDPAVAESSAVAGFSIAEPGDENSKQVVMQAEDDVRMAYFEDNTIMLNETGVQLKQGGNARFDRNYIARCTKTGIIVLDEGRGEFFENVLTDCPQFALYIQGDPRGKVQLDPSWLNVQDCVISHAKVGVSIAGGEPRIACNRIFNCETGFNVGPQGNGIMLGNLVHDCKRVGGICYSDLIAFKGNTFYSSLELGAFEMKLENVKLPMGNIVRNQFSPRVTKADPAQKVNLLGEQVNEATSAKEQRDLFNNLRDMHVKQLPASELGGCPRMGIAPHAAAAGSLSAAAAEMASSARKKSVAVPGSANSVSDALSKSLNASHFDDYAPPPPMPMRTGRSFVRAPTDDDHDGGNQLVDHNKWAAASVVAFQPSVISMTANNKSWTMSGVKMGKQEAVQPKPKESIVFVKKKAAAAAPPKVRKIKRQKPQKKAAVDDDDDDDRAVTPSMSATPPVSQRPSPKQQRPVPMRGSSVSSPVKRTASPKGTEASNRDRSSSPPHSPRGAEQPVSDAAQVAVDEDLPPLSSGQEGAHVVDLQFPGTRASSSTKSAGSRPASHAGVSPVQRPETAGDVGTGSRHSRSSSRYSQHLEQPSPLGDGGDVEPFSPEDEGSGGEGAAGGSQRSLSRHSSVASVRTRAGSSGSVRDPSGRLSSSGTRLSRASSSGAFTGPDGGIDDGDEVLHDGEDEPSGRVMQEVEDKQEPPPPPPRRVSPVLIRRKRTAPARIMSRRRVAPPAASPDGTTDQPSSQQPRRRGDRPSLISILDENDESMSTGRTRGMAKRLRRTQSENGILESGGSEEMGEDQQVDEESAALPTVTMPLGTAATPSPASSSNATPQVVPLPPITAPLGQPLEETSTRSDDNGEPSSQEDVDNAPPHPTAGTNSEGTVERVMRPTTKLLPPSCRRWSEDQRRDRKTRRRSALKTDDLSAEDMAEEESTLAVVNQPIVAGKSSHLQASQAAEDPYSAGFIPKGSLSDDEYVSLIVNHTRRIAIPSNVANPSLSQQRNRGEGRFTFYRGESPNFNVRRLYGSQSPRMGQHADDDDVEGDSTDSATCSSDDDDDALSLENTWDVGKQRREKIVQLGFMDSGGKGKQTLTLPVPHAGRAATPSQQHGGRCSHHHLSCDGKKAGAEAHGGAITPKPMSCISLDLGGLVQPPHPRSMAYDQYIQDLLRKKGGVVHEALAAGPRSGPHIPIVPSLSELPTTPPIAAKIIDGAIFSSDDNMDRPSILGLSRRQSAATSGRRALQVLGNGKSSSSSPVETSTASHFDMNFFPPPNLSLRSKALGVVVAHAPVASASTLPAGQLDDGQNKHKTIANNATIGEADGPSRFPLLSPRSPATQRLPSATPLPTLGASPVTPSYSLPMQLASRPPTGAELRAGRTGVPPRTPQQQPQRRASDVRFQQGSKHIIFGDCEAMTRRRHRSHTVDATSSSANVSRSATPALAAAGTLSYVGHLVKRGAGEALIPFTNM